MWNSTRSHWRPTLRGHSERGVALPGVLLLAAFLVGVTGWLVGTCAPTSACEPRTRRRSCGRRLAESAVQSVAMALGQRPDWTPVDSLALALPCALVGRSSRARRRADRIGPGCRTK